LSMDSVLCNVFKGPFLLDM